MSYWLINNWILVLFICFQVLIGLLTIFLNSFIRKKGENWANKEDLNAITTIVEGVKSEFQKENELLKASLSEKLDISSQLFSEKKKSLIDFFSELSDWYLTKCYVRLDEFNHTNYFELQNIIDKMNNQFASVQVLFARVQLIVNDGPLEEAGYEAIKATLSFQHFIEGICSSYMYNLSMEKNLIDSLISRNREITPEKFNESIRTAAENYNNRKVEIFNKYINNQNAYFSVSLEKVNLFKQKAIEQFIL